MEPTTDQPATAPTTDEPTRTPTTKTKIAVKQLRILLNAIEANPSLYNVDNSDIVSFMTLEKWMDLAEELNASLGDTHLITVPNWKYILRYWCDKTKTKMAGQHKPPKNQVKLTREEIEELAELERRLFAFMEREEANKADDDEVNDDCEGASGRGVKIVMELQDVFPSTQDENAAPGQRSQKKKKRTITLHESDFNDLGRLTKKFKVIYDENMEGGEPQEHVDENELDRAQDVSRKIQGHISSIQSRIHMIKDMWKHRCGDN